MRETSTFRSRDRERRTDEQRQNENRPRDDRRVGHPLRGEVLQRVRCVIGHVPRFTLTTGSGVVERTVFRGARRDAGVMR